ncbi:MAG: epoxide hydrolase [Verrucomicrobiota bacterium]
MKKRQNPIEKVIILMLVLSAATWTRASEDAPEVRPFEISISDETLDELKERLRKTRFPSEAPKEDWQYGVQVEYMKSFVDDWLHSYDWRKTESTLNRYDHFLTEIDGLDIHFMHIKSKHEDAKPLLLLHGWPGSFVEFMELIEPLTDPEAHGGSPEDAFHLVIPSLPGFGFSEAPNEPGWSFGRMAPVMSQLMARLGYERYGAQGGDWGAGVSIALGINDSDHVLGVHLNHPGFMGGIIPDENPWKGVSANERERHANRKSGLTEHWGYGRIQGSRPQTISYALNDSPAGLAAWILDKFYAWSDHGGDLDSAFNRERLIDNIMIYWLTESLPSSVRVYFEKDNRTLDTENFSVPIGAALFPKEISQPPRRWFERKYGDNVKQYNIMPEGGHFAAMEEPELLIEEIRSFFDGLQ